MMKRGALVAIVLVPSLVLADSRLLGKVTVTLNDDDALVACVPPQAWDGNICCWPVTLFYKFQWWDEGAGRWEYVPGHEPGGQGPVAGYWAENRFIGGIIGDPDRPRGGYMYGRTVCEDIAHDVKQLKSGKYRLVPLKAVWDGAGTKEGPAPLDERTLGFRVPRER